MNVDELARGAGTSLRAATEPALDITDALHQTMQTSRRRRRNARVAGIALVVALVVGVLTAAPDLLADRASKLPGTHDQSPTPSATPGVYTLVADPFLTADEWAGFWGPGKLTTDGTIMVAPPVVRSDTDPSLINCVGDVHGLAAREVQSATYAVGAKGGFNNEFILRYASGQSAAPAMADLRNQFARCYRSQRNPRFFLPALNYVLVAPTGPIDEMFEGEAPDYQVYAAREGNVIVLVENEGGWGDRTSVALRDLLDQALGQDWEGQ